MGGGRGLGGQGRQSCLASLQVYLHPASRRSGRGGRCLPSQLTHTTSQLSICSSSALSPPNSMCVRGGEAAVNSFGRRFTSCSRLGSSTPRLASLCLDSTCWRQWPCKDRPTYSLAGKSANTRAARHKGEEGPPRTWPCGHKQVSVEPEFYSDSPRISGC